MLMKNPTPKQMKPKDVPAPSNVRSPIDPNTPENIEFLASIKTHGVLQPLLVSKQRGLIAGHRRLWASIAAGLELIPVLEIDGPITDSEFTLLQIVENVHRSDLSGHEKAAAVRQVLSLNPGWQMQELAANLNLSPPTITKLLSPFKCTPEWQEALKAGKVTIDNCYTASKLPLDQQNGLLAQKLSGANREQLEEAVKRSRTKATDSDPPQRTARVRIPLAVETKEVTARGTVTIASVPGEEIDLGETETLLKEAMKAVRDAQSRGLGLKAAQAAWKDIASAKKAGA